MKHIKLVYVNHVRPCSLLVSSLLLIYLPINTLCDTYITYVDGDTYTGFFKRAFESKPYGSDLLSEILNMYNLYQRNMVHGCEG